MRLSWFRPQKGLYIFGVKKKTTPFKDQVAIQSWLCPALTPVPCNVDYSRFSEVLEDVSNLLRDSSIESHAIDLALEGYEAANARSREHRARYGVESVRVAVLRALLGMPSYRELARMICSSDLLARFCGLARIDGIRGASKSTLERRCRLFSPDDLRAMLSTLTSVCGNRDLCAMTGLSEPVAMDVCLIDSSCVDANIHHPVDWASLGDISRTLLKAVRLIRNEGLRCRMPCEPQDFDRQMNHLGMEMTHARRRKHAGKVRKGILRRMKKSLRIVGAHARRHCDKLKALRPQTRFSEKEAARIIARIERMLGLIDPVIAQAHERIIGGRPVSNADKVLSVHDDDVNVVVRGKASGEVEFGNTLNLCENMDGYVMDWWLYREQAPGEPRQLRDALDRQYDLELDSPISAVCSDRGFASRAITRLLEESGIYDATCPRDVSMLRERTREPRFCELQRRRASTEARIATVINRWLGGRPQCRSYTKRALHVGWAVLSHNLWLIARMLSEQRKKAKAAA